MYLFVLTKNPRNGVLLRDFCFVVYQDVFYEEEKCHFKFNLVLTMNVSIRLNVLED